MSPTLGFAAFVFWLLALPMNGPLLSAAGIADATQYFLLPHILSLGLIGAFLPADHFKKLAPACALATILLSMALALQPAAAPWLLILVGVSGAFVAIDATTRLRCAKNPVLSAALGLVLGNFLLFILHLHATNGLWHFALVALPLLILLAPARHEAGPEDSFPWANFLRYLPFVMVFHIVGGLMYSVLYPAYEPAAMVAGAELPFYMLTAVGAVWIIKKHQELTLILGILLGMIAFATLKFGHPLSINLSMFALQAGQGFVDLFLLAYLLSFHQRNRAVGLGLAVLCLGIFVGQFIGRNLQEFVGTIVMAGHISLNLAVLTLYFFGRRRHEAIEPAAPPSEAKTQNSPPLEERVPEHMRLLLSQRECLVLAHSLDGRTYREIAADLDISESSVKTYMKRICDKLGVRGRKGLFEALEAR